MLQQVEAFLTVINRYLFGEVMLGALLLAGILFTVWSRVGQYRAVTHGVAVLRGRYDDPSDPGAISHFQALSAALSATVGLGNIGGVALAVALGGPGAIFWMWIIGAVGMALKMTEVIQSMLYRNLKDPQNPHGGPMFVAREGFRRLGWPRLGAALGGLFSLTLLVSTCTGGNMFQAWNVAEVTFTYFGVPQIAAGVVLAVLVGLVILGGIRRIGAVAARIVPSMCALYLLAALYVLFSNLSEIPGLLALIVRSGLPAWLGGEAAAAEQAFLGASFGFAAMWGVKRALFSSEAGQGSAPIAHAAAKTDEPVREGVVAGLEPLVDTLLVCTLTALVILSSGAWNRAPEAYFPPEAEVEVVRAQAGREGPAWSLRAPELPPKTEAARWLLGEESGPGWRKGETVFVVVEADVDARTGRSLRRVAGKVTGSEQAGFRVEWAALASRSEPALARSDGGAVGVYGDYAGASLTAHAFDRTLPGLGKWLILIASWLFGLSTILSWSYYGEQAVIYLGGQRYVRPYRLVYCALVAVATLGFIKTDAQLDAWTTLGMGLMLSVNVPIMLIFSRQAMRAYHEYVGRLKAGRM